ncbi:MAG: hypothetical protein IJS81_01210 [Selenomonadaceae bacterium]|nr:hypothetical protein [Selenomonadaceae bacterium]
MNKIRNDGRFLRIKTFVDAVSVPMCDIFLKIYKHSAAALTESAVWYDKRDQLYEWQQEFVTRSRKKLDALYNELSEKLKKAIYTFAENHYEDENVNENWIREFKRLHFEEDYQIY